MISNKHSSEIVLSDSVWQVVMYIVECSHLESFPGLFELIHRYHTCADWNQALHTSNGSRAWHIAACRSLGSVPPFLVDPMTTYDVESAVHAFLIIFSGGYCSCGSWTKELPVAYEDHVAQWSCLSCQMVCEHDTHSAEDPFAWRPQAEVESFSFKSFSHGSDSWEVWRKAARKAINDPAFLSRKRLQITLQEWFNRSSFAWEDLQNSKPVVIAFNAVRAYSIPLSSNGCEVLAQRVMENFTELNGDDSDEGDVDQWEDALKDDDENENIPIPISTTTNERPITPTKGSSHFQPEPKSPFGISVANRVPALTQIRRKDYV